jgi:hypothetical protein
MRPKIRRIAAFGILIAIETASAFSQATASGARELSVRWDAASGRAMVINDRLELVIETGSGLNARSLRDSRSGWALADRDYAWPDGGFPKVAGEPSISELPGGGRSITFRALLGLIVVEQSFTVTAAEPGVIYERITIRNPGRDPVSTAGFKCGFAKCLRKGDLWTGDAGNIFSPIPYRRETNGKMQEFPLRDTTEHGMSYFGWGDEPVPTPVWGAEGWVWSRGRATFLLSKFNPKSLEWSLMEPDRRGDETVIRFGGAGQWKFGHPEGASELPPGGSFQFGESRFQVVEGDWKQAFYAYRAYTVRKGCAAPRDYNPPVHWNELYDNEYYFKVCKVLEDKKVWHTPEFDALNQKLLAQYYSLDLMLGEAAKAADLGCEALYLDPGWDDGPNSHIWDASRLGPMDGFVAKLWTDYHLRLSLWTALGGVPPTYGDPNSCPPEARLMDKDGRRTELLCFASPAFLDTKEKRLLELCRQGAVFLMLDSDQFSGPCYDGSHGHRIPSTREEHAAAILELIRRVKTRYSKVMIELHDPVTGPGGSHYTPTTFGAGRPDSFDCLWGHEFMWDPLDDILARRAVSLYYYNLAYSIPLYLHVNLKKDNESSLVFWWFASTCRHLGVGGKPGPEVWEAEKRAMRTYKSLKDFYTRGVFYGLEETVHAHVLPERQTAVINVFNLEEGPVSKSIRFRPEEIGLPRGEVEIEGASFAKAGDGLAVILDLPARGHRLLKVRSTGRR